MPMFGDEAVRRMPILAIVGAQDALEGSNSIGERSATDGITAAADRP
jgi:hypothetical protein